MNLMPPLTKKSIHLKQLVDETHNAYGSSIDVLQTTINGLQRSLTVNSSIDKILRLTKEIYQLLFNQEIRNNHQLCDVMKSQFNEAFSKIDGVKQ